MKKVFLLVLILPLVSFAQRGKTGDKTYAYRFPADVVNEVSNAMLVVKNEVEHDVIVLLRDQRRKYLRHVYIRKNQEYTFKELPLTRIFVQFKSLEFYFEQRERTHINFGEKHTFHFFYDASLEGNYFKITEAEFFSH